MRTRKQKEKQLCALSKGISLMIAVSLQLTRDSNIRHVLVHHWVNRVRRIITQ